MGPHIQALAGQEFARLHLIEGNGVADQLAPSSGQRPADLEALEVMGTGDE